MPDAVLATVAVAAVDVPTTVMATILAAVVDSGPRTRLGPAPSVLVAW
jgi:hypothetical protein